jgi:hypothetical protein
MRISAISWRMVILAGLSGLVLAHPALGVGSPLRVKWDGLSMVVGKTVAIAMPDATVITGKAVSVQADALEVQVTKSTNPAAWPKGLTRVPRATLRTVEMRTKSVHYRVIGIAVGFLAGTVGGVGAAVGIQGGLLDDEHPRAAVAALIGIAAAGTVGGYAVGNGADRRSTMIEIVPEEPLPHPSEHHAEARLAAEPRS